MKLWTYQEILDKVRRDLGLEQEDFVTDQEMIEYCNEAISECESLIHTNYEDYFLTVHRENLVAGQDMYLMPDNMYAHKIRSLIFKESDRVHLIKRYKRSTSNSFYEVELDSVNSGSIDCDEYKYLILNTTEGSKASIKLIPTPLRNITNGLIIYYYRNANRMEDRESICDIPEFVSYVIQFIKLRCYEKEGNPNISLAAEMLDRIRENMEVTLNDMTPDNDNNIEADLDIYYTMS